MEAQRGYMNLAKAAELEISRARIQPWPVWFQILQLLKENRSEVGRKSVWEII